VKGVEGVEGVADVEVGSEVEAALAPDTSVAVVPRPETPHVHVHP
jgi:hypothetical protein